MNKPVVSDRPETTMNRKGAALIALAGFGLGVSVGKGFAAFEVERTAGTRAPITAVAALPVGHPAVTERDLGDAVATTLQMQVAPATTAMASDAASLASATNLIEKANDLRRQRKFKEAAEAYRRAAAEGRMSADSWADYADALGSVGSSLTGAPAAALAKALELDPRHPKALWLKASLEHEEQRYREAASTWRNLLAVVPTGSSDARIIEANIAEAMRLAAGQG